MWRAQRHPPYRHRKVQHPRHGSESAELHHHAPRRMGRKSYRFRNPFQPHAIVSAHRRRQKPSAALAHTHSWRKQLAEPSPHRPAVETARLRSPIPTHGGNSLRSPHPIGPPWRRHGRLRRQVIPSPVVTIMISIIIPPVVTIPPGIAPVGVCPIAVVTIV